MFDLDQKMARAWAVRTGNFRDEITWASPLDTAALSLTGAACALDCGHCGGHYLGGMKAIWETEPDGSSSCLISGGCDTQGRIPVLSHQECVRAWRQGRTMNWHVGFVSDGEMEAISPLVDVVSFDFVGDDATIREVYGTDRRVEDYVDAYCRLRRYARTVPHVTLGLRGGELGHEMAALRILQSLGADGLVLLVFVPTAGTRYADHRPPLPEAVAELVAEARIRLPLVPIYLGCMRPPGRYRDLLDPLALRAGVNVIVNPSRSARRLAASLHLHQLLTRECCVLAPNVASVVRNP